MFRATILLSVLIVTPALSQVPSWRPDPAEIAAADYGPAPQNHEKIVKAWFAENLKDPASSMVRDIVPPKRHYVVTDPFKRVAVYGYSVCATVNAKNGLGGYTGWRVWSFLIRGGEVVTSINDQGKYRFLSCQR